MNASPGRNSLSLVQRYFIEGLQGKVEGLGGQDLKFSAHLGSPQLHSHQKAQRLFLKVKNYKSCNFHGFLKVNYILSMRNVL